MTADGPLGLRLPEQTRPAADTFLLNTEKTKAWIADLPLANVGETSRRVLKTIADCNRTAMSPAIRMQIVEEFREPIAYVEKNLQKRYIGASFPLAPKTQSIALVNRELHTEMAISQKIIIADLFSGQAGQFNRESLDIAIHKALEHLRNILLHSYLAYESCPPDTWRDIHRLAAYGLPDRLLTPISEPSGNQRAASIHRIYTGILLLAASAPYKLQQREILAVNEKIEEWGSRTRLLNPLSIQARNDDKGLFMSDLTSDSPPRHLSLIADPHFNHSIILDTGGLIAPLERKFRARASQNASREHTDETLLSKLLQVWSSAPKRKHPRTKLHFELKIAVGLNAIWGLLTAGRIQREKSDSTPTVKRAQDTSTDSEWREQTDMLQHTLKSGFFKTGGESVLSLSPLDDDRAPPNDPGLAVPVIDFGPQKDTLDVWSSHDPASFQTHVFRTIDESAGGYCVSWTGKDIPRVTIGELIGIQSPTHEMQYALATIRWVKNMPGEGLKLGMQLIARSVLAVEQLPERGEPQQSLHCLLVPERRATASPASLICPALQLQVGDIARLRVGDEESRIRLTRRLEQTSTFSRFLFRLAEKQ